MNKLFLTFLLSALLFQSKGECQTNDIDYKSKIATVVENYFDLEREAIHLHIDKTSFITQESIWYQGYIINRKTNKPFFTTNVFIVLYDQSGKALSEKLIYASNGVFSGSIELKPTYHSGKYYIQAYTNWMNNFSENESTIRQITLINPNEGSKDYNKINTNSLQLSLHPEGNSFIKGISNTIGVSVKDCRGNAPENLDAIVQNTSGEEIKRIKLNAFGYGKLDIIPNEVGLKIKVETGTKTLVQDLPPSEPIGFALSVNNFTLEGKTVLKIKSNNATQHIMNTKKVFIVVHQDQKYSIYNLELDANLEQLITLNNTDLFEGINTIRIIDSDMKQWCERLVYVYPKTYANATLTIEGKLGNNVILKGESNLNNANLSLTVLPEDTKSLDNNTTIISGLTINPYLNEPLNKAYYYFNSINRTKLYELDLVVLNQTSSKYQWEAMKLSPPTTKYSFDIGLSLKGTIDPNIKNKTFHKVKLVSFKDFIMMSSDISEKGDYLFEHVLIADSTFVKMSLEKLPNFDKINTKITPQILHRKKPFYKSILNYIATTCNDSETEAITTDFELPRFASKTIQLKTVVVTVPKKKMTYENRLGNASLRAIKVDDSMQNQNLLYLIESNGFDVVRNLSSVTIYSRHRNSINAAQPQPEITIDGRTVMTHDELTSLSMSEIDEIYISPHAIVASMKNNMGAIHIYTKQSFAKYTPKQDPNSFYIKEGFSRNTNFKNADYINSNSEGFDYYGIMEWVPQINTDENGIFNATISSFKKKKAKYVLEGMTNDGKIYHQTQVIELK